MRHNHGSPNMQLERGASPPAPAGTAEPALPAWPGRLVAAAVLLSSILAGIYRGLEAEYPRGLEILGSLLVASSVVIWFRAYSRAFGISQPMDMGWFLLLAWPAVVPYFIISREGRRGLRRIGYFVTAWIVAACLGFLTAFAVASLGEHPDDGEGQAATRDA